MIRITHACTGAADPVVTELKHQTRRPGDAGRYPITMTFLARIIGFVKTRVMSRTAVVRLDLEIERQFYEAIREDRVDLFENLVESNSDCLHAPFLGGCLLHYVASFSHDNVKMIEFLLKEGMPVDNTTFNNEPPLGGAVDAGSISIARILLEAGADPNQDRHLIGAINAEKNSLELVKLLVEFGVDVNREFRFWGRKGPLYSALSWAETNEKQEIVDFLRARAVG